MKDKEFKELKHQVGNGNKISTQGEEISKGYKPDITVEDKNGNLLYILECENKTDRKAFLGAFLKAEMHSDTKKQRPELIIVMHEKDNTSTKQIADHIRPYKCWLQSKNNGKLSLSDIHVLSDEEYQTSILNSETLGSQAFKNHGHIV